MRLGATLAVTGLLLTVAVKADAMNFGSVQIEPHQYAIGGVGEIEPGDDLKLHELVGSLPADAIILAVVLDSPGGNLLEGTRLARTIRNSHVPTRVSGTCASACFLMWAAGTSKGVQYGARIGVHSASYMGGETPSSQALTTQMARLAHEFGVPDAIIGRMVSTPPNDMAWLTRRELNDMPGVRFMEARNDGPSRYEPGSALQPGSSIPPTPAGPTPILPSQHATATPVDPDALAQPAPSRSFLSGRQARLDWEQWFNSISGDTHDGASWWAAHRGTAARDRLTCENQASVSGAWVLGCSEARMRLVPVDRARMTDIEFKAGWNSL